VELPSYIGGTAVDATGVWIAHPQESVLRRIEDGEVVMTVELEEPVGSVAFDGRGQLWGSASSGLLRFDIAAEN
jgi:hypothetical protein